MPPVAGRWLADTLPNATLDLIAGSAHAPFVSDPAAFAAALAAATGQALGTGASAS